MLAGGFRAACMLCMSPGSTNASPALEGYLPIRSRHRQKVQVRQYKEVTEGLRSDSITQSPGTSSPFKYPKHLSPTLKHFSRPSSVTRDVETMAGSEDYKIKNLIATIILCTTLSTLSFIGRLWGRSLSAVSLGWDDFFMASAVVCKLRWFTVGSCAILPKVQTNRHG